GADGRASELAGVDVQADDLKAELGLARRAQVGILAAPDVVDSHARLDRPRRELMEGVVVAVDAELRRQQPVEALAEATLAADELMGHAGPPLGSRRFGGSPCRPPILPKGAGVS